MIDEERSVAKRTITCSNVRLSLMNIFPFLFFKKRQYMINQLASRYRCKIDLSMKIQTSASLIIIHIDIQTIIVQNKQLWLRDLQHL